MFKSQKVVRKAGFTLVELLVVISIIALLLAVLIPSLKKAKEVANRVVCSAHLKDFGTANQLYVNASNGFYLPMSYLELNPKGTVLNNGQYYKQVKWMENKLFRSFVHYDTHPKDKKSAPRPGAADWDIYNGPYNMPKALLCPADIISIDWKNQSESVLVSYAANLTDWPANWNGPPKADYMGFKVTAVKQPAGVITFIDSVDWWVTYWGRSANYRLGWDTHRQMSIVDYKNPSLGLTQIWGPVIYRHSEGAVLGFYDGHVKYMKKQDIYNPGSLHMWSVQQ